MSNVVHSFSIMFVLLYSQPIVSCVAFFLLLFLYLCYFISVFNFSIYGKYERNLVKSF